MKRKTRKRPSELWPSQATEGLSCFDPYLSSSLTQTDFLNKANHDIQNIKSVRRNQPTTTIAVQATAAVTVGLDAVIIAAHYGAQALELGSRPEELEEAVNPPQSAELLLHLMPERDREYILGDLEEDFRTDFLPKFGPEKARRLYWWHAVRSVLAVVLGRVRWLIRVAAVGWLLGKLGL